jgi:UrcA family protein
MKRLFTSICFAACAAAAFAAPAAADDPHRITRVVQVGDLDLHSEAGAKQAAFRIHVAADYVCGGDNNIWRQSMDFDSCRDQAIDRALASIDAPLVSAALGRPTPIGMASR